MNGIAARLTQARIGAGHATAEQAAKLLGIKSSTYRAHENGQNDISLESAARYAQFFGVSLSYLATGEGSGGPAPHAPGARMPEIATTGATEFRRDGSPLNGLKISGEWMAPASYVRELGHDVEDIAIVRMPSDSMSPTFLRGDRVIIDLTFTSFTADGIYAVLQNGEIGIYRIQNMVGQHGSDRTVTLVCDNANYLPMTVRLHDLSVVGLACGGIVAR